MACSKGLSQRLKEDRISQLPDPLLTQILNLLTTEEAVKTSVLSTRWRTLWLWVPNLELSFSKFPSFNAFLSFGNWFFDSVRVSCIDNLKLYIDGNDASYLKPWIDALVKRKIQRLYVRRTLGGYSHEMPLSLYVCESLVSLKLFRLTLVDAEFVSLPCLKILRLKDIVFHNEATFEKLVSSCPVLEELKIDVVWNDGNVYRVHSRSLKRFCFRRSSSLRFDSVPGVVIDAPLLCCLIIDDSVSENFIVTDLESNAKLDISLRLPFWGFDEAKRSNIRMFLAWISRVRDMKICAHTFKLIHHYSEFEPLPRFGYMPSLYVTLNALDLKLFPIFLRSCPNLKSLILERIGCSHQLSPKVKERGSISSVPECLLTTLEFVEFKDPIWGLAPEMKLVWYFLENSPTLKKLTLRLKSHLTKDDFVKKLLKIPRGATDCEIVIL